MGCDIYNDIDRSHCKTQTLLKV